MKIKCGITKQHPAMRAIFRHAEELQGDLTISETGWSEDGQPFDLIEWLESLLPITYEIEVPDGTHYNGPIEYTDNGEKFRIIPKDSRWPAESAGKGDE